MFQQVFLICCDFAMYLHWVLDSEPGVKHIVFQLFNFKIKFERRDLVEIDPEAPILKNLSLESATHGPKLLKQKESSYFF